MNISIEDTTRYISPLLVIGGAVTTLNLVVDSLKLAAAALTNECHKLLEYSNLIVVSLRV